MSNTKQEISEQIKENINTLLASGNVVAAENLLEQYKKVMGNDRDVYCIQAGILIQKHDFIAAQQILEVGLDEFSGDFDILYNLAYVLTLQEEFSKAAPIYSSLMKGEYSVEQQAMARSFWDELAKKHNLLFQPVETKKMVFFVKQGLDNFIDEIIEGLSGLFQTKKIIVTDFRQIDEYMKWADICWFEWCDELIIHGSRSKLAKDKKIICRLHRYEAFSQFVEAVVWDNVDEVIFVPKLKIEMQPFRFPNKFFS